MSRIYEYKAKELLRKRGFNVPDGMLITCDKHLEEAFSKIGQGVLKAQVFITGRAGKGLIKFPNTLKELKNHVDELLGKKVDGLPVKTLLYEKRLSISDEFYTSIIVDKSLCQPVLMFSSHGGSGIEEIAVKHPYSIFKKPIDLKELTPKETIISWLRTTKVKEELLDPLAKVIINLIKAAIEMETVNLEINPIILNTQGKLFLADCHITVDDYAVFRHPEFEIEVPRELGHPPTELEKIAWNVEKHDYRGTFYFIQLERGFDRGNGYVGFHGAGGGGSMMAMDALENFGYKPANFCDTSGNPPASKVYRAARIILAQENIDGYFGSGSGVASQEQFHSARGIVKALKEVNPDFPVVMRLGGNGEEEAIRILEGYTKDLRASVNCFGKDTSVTECVKVLDNLIKDKKNRKASPVVFHKAEYSEKDTFIKNKEYNSSYSFKTVSGGIVSFDYSMCATCNNKICITGCYAGILKEEKGFPVLNILAEEALKGRCIECLVCEVECQEHGNGGGRITLPIEGLEKREKNSNKGGKGF